MLLIPLIYLSEPLICTVGEESTQPVRKAKHKQWMRCKNTAPIVGQVIPETTCSKLEFNFDRHFAYF